MPQAQIHEVKRYSYADYLTWSDGERWELLDGSAYNMSPAPNVRHQRISMDLSRQFSVYLKDKTCQVYAAPFDVRLSDRPGLTDDKVETVVQPDLLVICDKNKLDDRGCNGPPDLIVEILSQSSAAHDLKIKFELYERYGVKEYWIIHPAEQTLLVYRLNNQARYGAADRFASDDEVPIPLLGNLVVNLGEIFAE